MSQKFGKYRLHDSLNEGGMTEIWLATDKNEKVVAVRRLRNRVGSNASKLFRNGLAMLRKLPSHPNIIGYQTHGKERGTPYMVLDYINGGNLKQLALRQDPVISENVSDVLIGITDALEHIHDHGWMHLDFKPENVMVDRQGHAYLLDFDTAKPIPRRPKRYDKTSGTPAYMPPEQLRGRALDQRADIYSFGVTAYELLTNRRPHAGNTPAETRKNQLNENFRLTPASKYNPGVPSKLNAILRQCLKFDPNLRFPNLTILNAQLHAALGVKMGKS